jgi:hypothetical protein
MCTALLVGILVTPEVPGCLPIAKDGQSVYGLAFMAEEID